METFKIAAVQMNALIENLDHNLSVHRKFTLKAASAGCRMILFPELSVTAHFGDEGVLKHAETAGNGPIYKYMLALAKEANILICYGFAEVDHGAYFVSQCLIGPDGIKGIHRKVHASKDEYFYFRMGRKLEVFDLGFCRIGILICYDSVFFEAWRELALKGADVILLPHAGRSGWGTQVPVDQQIQHLTTELQQIPGKSNVTDRVIYARANNVFGVFTNQCDFNGHSTHSGLAFIASPQGDILEKSQPTIQDQMIITELNKDIRIAASKDVFSTLKDRRPETYTTISKPV